MEELYKTNKDFSEYVDKYCAKHKVTKEEAFSHLIIRAIANMYDFKRQKHSEGYCV